MADTTTSSADGGVPLIPIFLGITVVIGIGGYFYWKAAKKQSALAESGDLNIADGAKMPKKKDESGGKAPSGNMVGDISKNIGDIISGAASTTAAAMAPSTPEPLKDKFSTSKQLISLGQANLAAAEIIKQIGWNAEGVWKQFHNGNPPTGHRAKVAMALAPYFGDKANDKFPTEWEQAIPLTWQNQPAWVQSLTDKLNSNGYIIRAPFKPKDVDKVTDPVYPIDNNTVYKGNPIGSFTASEISQLQKDVLANKATLSLNK